MDTPQVIQMADELKRQGRHQEAIGLCQKILMDDLDCTEAYEEIGDNYLSLKEYPKAMKALQRAVAVNPQSANGHYLIGFLHSAVGNYHKSILHLNEADEIQPNHPEILRCLGWSVFHGSSRKKGIVLLDRALQMSPYDTLVMCDLAVCYLNDRQFNNAIGLLKKALHLEPDNPKAQECLETAMFFKKEYKKINDNKQSKGKKK